jgi:hypothetical protein
MHLSCRSQQLSRNSAMAPDELRGGRAVAAKDFLYLKARTSDDT